MQNQVNLSTETYQSPLASRYASKEMSRIFSAAHKHALWRALWIALAESQRELGLNISEKQINELKTHAGSIDFEAAMRYENEVQHDVMAHILAYGDACPSARPIIHLGATSCFVTDNTDLLQIKEALGLLLSKLETAIRPLKEFAGRHASLPCLGFTHFQPAQLTTVGKRACLWLQDFFIDYQALKRVREELAFLGAKGAVGTQASYLALFDGDHEKVKALDVKVAAKMGFDRVLIISGQTYTRKQDVQVLHALAGFASSAHKMAVDLRLLTGLKELQEPFGAKQVGSTAMPYKRNPILSERMCSLARFLLSLAQNGDYTHAVQWLERSLDDSANRRLTIPEAFLCADALASLLTTLIKGLHVDIKAIGRHIAEELPFLAAENILMHCVKKGGDRQDLHERIRRHSLAASEEVKQHPAAHDFIDRLAHDPAFGLSKEELTGFLDPLAFIGRAPQQVEEFLQTLTI